LTSPTGSEFFVAEPAIPEQSSILIFQSMRSKIATMVVSMMDALLDGCSCHHSDEFLAGHVLDPHHEISWCVSKPGAFELRSCSVGT
jgi:hypothetical protein